MHKWTGFWRNGRNNRKIEGKRNRSKDPQTDRKSEKLTDIPI
jgi:hypothetical protein